MESIFGAKADCAWGSMPADWLDTSFCILESMPGRVARLSPTVFESAELTFRATAARIAASSSRQN
eukprot:2424748-Pyramimonas_sp.AAC.1